MKAYIVVRYIHTVRGDVVTVDLQAFDDMDGANDHCSKLDDALVHQMECMLFHPTDKETPPMSGNDFLASLGIATVSHRVITMPVKQSSLIKVPKLEIVKH
jgi:hypothetical protein